MPRFTVFRDGRAERSLTLMLDDISIGRMPGAHLELPQASVSRRHARIRRDGGAWLLEDLGSVNGIVVSGERVRRHSLRPGDRFRIEDFEIVWEPADDLYESGLLRDAASESDAKAFSMTYLSAGNFTASPRDRG